MYCSKKNMQDSLSNSVLLIDKVFTPLRSISWKRAMKLNYLKKANFLLPDILQLLHYRQKIVKKPLKYTNRAVYLRDRYRCQYCGKDLTKSSITIDHVIPRSKGGTSHFKNCVASCQRCNMRKADKLLSDVGMTLLQVPWEPTSMELLREHVRILITKFEEFLNQSISS